MERTSPSCTRTRIASRTGARLTFRLAAISDSTRRLQSNLTLNDLADFRFTER